MGPILRHSRAAIAFLLANGKLRAMQPTDRTQGRWVSVIGVLLGVCLLLGQSDLPAQDLDATLDLISARRSFNFFTWELRALATKMAYGLLAPQRFMDDETQSRYVLTYLDDVRESNRLSDEIDLIYANAEIGDPESASEVFRTEYATLRADMARRAPIAEGILESQVSQILSEGHVGVLASILPPVSGMFTPLPTILVVSPRDTIESVSQRQLVAGLTAAEQNTMEERVMEALPDVSAYVTEIGGLAAYPAMLLESGSIEWVTDVVAHEWTHHYLTFYPLGWDYMVSSEARTINETTASLIGEWAGQQLMLRAYDPLLLQEKALPEPLTAAEGSESGGTPVFDFNAEMHHTRVTVDALLAEGKVTEAEWYMEAQRRYFVANGYRIRRLNQAYFAFHGAYASSPGAAGSDPIGPLVRALWAISGTPSLFLEQIVPVTSLGALQAVVEEKKALGQEDVSPVDVSAWGIGGIPVQPVRLAAIVDVPNAYGIIPRVLRVSWIEAVIV